MRMYELMSGQQRPLVFTFEDLKFRFGVKDKYKLVGHFKARVLDIAKKELDESSPYSFNYIEVKEGRKVVGFKFFPTFNPDNKDETLYEAEMRSKVSASAQISREAYDYFRYSFEFKVDEISKNKKTIIEGKTNTRFYRLSLLSGRSIKNSKESYWLCNQCYQKEN